MQIKDTENYIKKKSLGYMHGDLEKGKLKCGENWERKTNVDGEKMTEF